MLHRFVIVRAIALLGVLALTVGPAPAADTIPYKINVILPLTGPLAFIGQTDQHSLKIFQDLTNKQGGVRGRPLQFVFADDQGSPQLSVQIASQILASKPAPAVVLGTASAGVCSAIEPLFQNAKTLQWCFSPTFYPPMGGYVYPSTVGSKDLMRVQVRYMKERGMKRLAILSTTDVSGKLGESELKDVLKEPGYEAVTLAADEVFGSADVGVGAQLAKIKAANPDALMIWTSGPALGTALTGVRDTGLDNLPIFAASSAMIWSQITGLASVLPKTLYFVGFGWNSDHGRNAAATRKLKEFTNAMNAASVHVDGVTGIVWDDASVTIDALRAIGTDATSEQLRSWIASQKNYPGIAGIYNYTTDMHGLGIDDVLIVRWDAQKQTWLPASKFGGLPL
jgi:branched-chain amino acid transport system substrate-binding protein